MSIQKDKELKSEFASFIGGMEWDLFITLHYYNGGTQNNNRRNIELLNKRVSNITPRMFFVSERSKDGDTHAHLLVKTSNRKMVKGALESLKRYCNVHCSEVNPHMKQDGVLLLGHYLSKDIIKSIDFDLFINDN
jgi:small nuclear ribonucleoprotein (snRNP)-like protein